ncbi:hypothetical protein SKAU_G00200940, partial [Synaphobranchus kaupii]
NTGVTRTKPLQHCAVLPHWEREDTYRDFNTLRLQTQMLLLFCWILICFIGNSLGQDAITSASKEQHVLDGSSVTLSCNYSAVNANNLQWYLQYPGSKPEFIILIYASAKDKTDKRFTVKHDKKNSRVHLEISSAKVTDSA